MLGQGILAVVAKGFKFTTLDELKTQLRAMNFKLTRTDHGVARSLDAKDDRLFEPPQSDRPNVTSKLELVPPAKDSKSALRFRNSESPASPPSCT